MGVSAISCGPCFCASCTPCMLPIMPYKAHHLCLPISCLLFIFAHFLMKWHTLSCETNPPNVRNFTL